LVVGTYYPIARNGFVVWDDDKNFLENTDFRGLGWPQICWAWRTTVIGVYQPLGWMILEVQAAAGGLDPAVYHLTSVAFHAANAVLLYALTLAVLRRCLPAVASERPYLLHTSAWMTAAAFALHPLRTEVVAWVSCQTYLPCVTFYLLAVLAYLRGHPGDGGPRKGWLTAAWLSFVAALLCKATAVSLPGLLLVLDAYPLGRFGRGPVERRAALREKVPFAVLSVVFMVVAVFARGDGVVPLSQDGVVSRLAYSCYSAGFYLHKTVLPVGLSCVYDCPLLVDWGEPVYVISAVCVPLFTGFLVINRRRWPAVLAAWAGYLVTLGPSIGLVRSGASVVADRYGYLPLQALAVLVAAAVCRAARRLRAAPLLVGLAALPVLVAGASLTRLQSAVWHDTEALWHNAMRYGAAGSAHARLHLGNYFLKGQRLRDAEAEMKDALRLNPDLPDARRGLGLVLLEQRRFAEALDQFDRALELEPDKPETLVAKASALSRLGRYAEAVAAAEAARRARPELAEAHYQRGYALAGQGRFKEALPDFEEALRQTPGHAEAHHDLGSALVALGRAGEAFPHFEESARLKPGLFEARHDLGLGLLRLDRVGEAVDHLQEAVRIKPDDAEAHMNFGIALERQGRGAEALTQFAEAVRLNPGNPDVRYNLGVALARHGSRDRAVAEFGAILRSHPEHANARGGLAALARVRH
jgi:tetratricopeptide (TPR) repeat protein